MIFAIALVYSAKHGFCVVETSDHDTLGSGFCFCLENLNVVI